MTLASSPSTGLDLDSILFPSQCILYHVSRVLPLLCPLLLLTVQGVTFSAQGHFSRPPVYYPSKLCFPAIFFSLFVFLFDHLLTPSLSLLSFVRCSFVPMSVYCQTYPLLLFPFLPFPTLSLLCLSLIFFSRQFYFFVSCVSVGCCRGG
ncbi:MAG: hypothetical protein JOS17DRAFT_473605 [Linnemannia elongata]|nr:MAG: hypothetical protein JOS17DRAFT_473605 [Linnemannia elongata]